jgi:F0F1-type ATP synthase assembly protein I
LTPNARNVEEVGVLSGHKNGGADSTAALQAYHARKRLITVRTSLFLVPLVALATWRNPVAGLQLALGGGIGVLNMLATMRANERLLEGRSNRAIFALNAQIRIFAVGMLPVAVAISLGEPWAVALYIAGFFTPLALYALAYHRTIKEA